jgi:hypothetical protein
VNILAAIDDPALFGQHFRAGSWGAWRTFLATLFGLPLSASEADIYRASTGRAELPVRGFNEAWLCCGRRAGKSFTLALIAVFLGCFHDYRAHLGPGERGTIMVIATDRRQARVIFRYIRGLLHGSEMLRRLIERETADQIDLVHAVTIEVQTASFRTTRGYTIVAALCDELAFWATDDAADPDYAILDALRPGMGTIPNAMLLCASSPYAQRGALFDAFRKYHGHDDAPVLIWRAATREVNPTLPQSTVDAAMERDPASAAAEYLAQFRNDVQGFVSREVVEGCVTRGVFERPPVSGIGYYCFVDPSGGSSDSMTVAIAHREQNRTVLDAIRERKPPFSPDAVVAEFAALMKRYGLIAVRGDRYGGEWPREGFRRHGVDYLVANKDRSALYVELLPLLNSGRADLLDHARCVTQFCQLERRAGRARDVIDHPPGGHDDICNSVAGALVAAGDRTDDVAVAAAVLVTGPYFDAAFSPPRWS